MLPWQLIVLLNRTRFIRKITLVSFIFHLVGCLFLFVVYRGGCVENLFFVSSSLSSHVSVRLVPLKKSVGIVSHALVQSKVNASKKNDVLLPKKTIRAQQQKLVTKKVPIKKIPIKKKTPVKLQPKKDIQKTVSHEVVKKKREHLLVEKETQKKNNAASSVSKNKEPFIEQVEKEKIIDIGEQELHTLQLQHALKESVVRVFTPPIGLLNDLSCCVTLFVDMHGHMKEYEMTKKSGVLVYDMAVKEALYQIDFPRGLWGQIITIEFRP